MLYGCRFKEPIVAAVKRWLDCRSGAARSSKIRQAAQPLPWTLWYHCRIILAASTRNPHRRDWHGTVGAYVAQTLWREGLTMESGVSPRTGCPQPVGAVVRIPHMRPRWSPAAWTRCRPATHSSGTSWRADIASFRPAALPCRPAASISRSSAPPRLLVGKYQPRRAQQPPWEGSRSRWISCRRARDGSLYDQQ